MHLIDRHPHENARALASHFVPPHRFEDVRFDNYQPNGAYPGQASALEELKRFADFGPTPARSRLAVWRARKRVADQPAKPARYLDGGFGVGKTHLLAALWHSVAHPKAYLSFGDLTAFIGFAGMEQAIAAFAEYRLVCIDEFELDDVANTLMVVSFLRGIMTGHATGRRATGSSGVRLAVTSNTIPDRLGEQRFSAGDFKREIAAIASYFDELPLDGPDYRTTVAALPLARHEAAGDAGVSTDSFDELLTHLGRIHPAQYRALLDGLDRVHIADMRPINDQDAALLWVQFVDKLYDARIPVHIDGCRVDEVFAASYRGGGYRKKYGRAESRIIAMQAESAMR